MMKRTKPILFRDKFVFRQGLQIGGVSFILIAVIVAMLWNTSSLNRVLEDSTKNYVKDVSYQLTNDIASRLESYETALDQLADSIPRLPDMTTTAEFLDRKAQILDFDALVIIDREGQTIPQDFDIENLKDLSGVQASFEGETTVIYVEGQNLLFSAPIETDGKVERVLAGVRRKENMQELIRSQNFEERGLTCIIDSEGQVVISPTDLKPFLQLEDIFQTGMDKETIHAVQEMQKDIGRQKSGVFRFTAVDNSQLILAYHALGVNDWTLLMMVPGNLISGEADLYVFRTFVIVGGIILIFALFLFLMFRFYKTNRQQLEKTAFTDSLTGGMNNAAFQVECQNLVNHAPLCTYTVVLLNVKGFKLINENFGITAGNRILCYIYSVLKRNMRTNEIAARGDADHFFMCLKECNRDKIQERLDAVIKEINSFQQSEDSRYFLTILQGACVVDEKDLNIRIIQDRARMACQLQKQKSKCAFYSAELTQKMKKEQELTALFENSIKDHDFHVYLQPKIRLKDSSIGGAEALVRWLHPQRGMIYPSDFIPLFEKNENICRLDLYVFEEVCGFIKKWMEDGKRPFPVSVNLSRVHFKNQDFLCRFSQIKEKYGIPDQMIELELTESIFFDEQQTELLKTSIGHMHRKGFLCSLDDFGAGFSSLGLLREVDVDTIKLDRQFFGNIANRKAQNVIASFIGLADKLGVHIVAEGIETEEQMDYLREVQCEMVQGYIFSKPLPILEFERWSEELESV